MGHRVMEHGAGHPSAVGVGALALCIACSDGAARAGVIDAGDPRAVERCAGDLSAELVLRGLVLWGGVPETYLQSDLVRGGTV